MIELLLRDLFGIPSHEHVNGVRLSCRIGKHASDEVPIGRCVARFLLELAPRGFDGLFAFVDDSAGKLGADGTSCVPELAYHNDRGVFGMRKDVNPILPVDNVVRLNDLAIVERASICGETNPAIGDNLC